MPTIPEIGKMLVTPGADVTVKLQGWLWTPDTVTTRFPETAVDGTETTICVLVQLLAFAATPLKVTVLDPCVVPKPAPVIVTDAPEAAALGETPVIVGVGRTVKPTPLLATLETDTTTLPVVAPLGTGTVMLVALQNVGAAAVPLNVTVLVPWDAPKFAPVIATGAPTCPDVGDKLETDG